ncbi:MAG: hypothetical protein U0228_35180 [Myxococcaceae bacterium]
MKNAILVSMVVLSGCGGAGVTLAFQNGKTGVSTQGLNARAPTSLGLKLLAVYLSEDVDPQSQNNTGATEMIWLHPDCQDDISHCELGAGTNPQDGQPYTHFVGTYFDFAQSTANVNAALAAQARSIAPGTYRYARLEFCKGNPSHANNLKWSVDGENFFEGETGGCGVTSAAMNPGLVVNSGDQVVVTLAYDLSSAVTEAPGAGAMPSNCSTAGCLQVPAFVPTASVPR